MDDLLRQELRAAESPEDKAAVVAEWLFNRLPEKAALVARRCTILHWFDKSFIEALLQVIQDNVSNAQDIYEKLKHLPFVESAPLGLAFNHLTQEGLIRRYTKNQQELLRTAAHLAALAYIKRRQDKKASAEAFYCYTVAGDTAQASSLLKELLTEAATRGDWEYMVGLFRLQDEAEKIPFVSSLPRPPEYERIRTRASGILVNPIPEKELVPTQQETMDSRSGVKSSPQFSDSFVVETSPPASRWRWSSSPFGKWLPVTRQKRNDQYEILRPSKRATILLRLLIAAEVVLTLTSFILFLPRNKGIPPIIPTPLPLLSSCTQSAFDDGHSTNVTKQVGTAEYTGISNGQFAFDAAKTRLDFDLKCKGALALRAGKPDEALTYWQHASQLDTNDAETLIYQEDLKVIQSGRPYITFVVGSILTGDAVGIGRDILQGAYVAQYLHNHNNNSPQIYLLVANLGSIVRQNISQAQDIEAKTVEQIITLVKNDIERDVQKNPLSLHIKGIVLGVPFLPDNIINLLDQSGAPVVLSGSFSESELQGTNNIFPVAASTDREGLVGATYVKKVFPNSKIAVFENAVDSYSESLASSFRQQFPSGTIVPEQYRSSDSDQDFLKKIADLQNNQANLIYFAGSSVDINRLLFNLPLDTRLHVMGGSALYQLGGYAGKNYSRLLFTAFAFPDEWNFPPQSNAIPATVPLFLKTYPKLFAGAQPAGVYGYVRPDSDVLLANDALSVLAQGSVIASDYGSNPGFLPAALIASLSNLSGPKAFQGFSGRISFGIDRTEKTIIVLSVDDQGLTHMDPPPYGCLGITLC